MQGSTVLHGSTGMHILNHVRSLTFSALIKWFVRLTLSPRPNFSAENPHLRIHMVFIMQSFVYWQHNAYMSIASSIFKYSKAFYNQTISNQTMSSLVLNISTFFHARFHCIYSLRYFLRTCTYYCLLQILHQFSGLWNYKEYNFARTVLSSS